MLCCAKQFAMAQIAVSPPATSDTLRLIQILKGNSLREKMVDTISFQTIAGDVMLRESLTLFTCDSAAVNKTTNVMEAFGNVHINQQDSIHTYAQYLKYIGKERKAYLKKNVRLTDKKGTLYTDELDYDLGTNIGNYKKGGDPADRGRVERELRPSDRGASALAGAAAVQPDRHRAAHQPGPRAVA